MKKITKDKVLILGDIHQDIGYANRCLELESDFDRVVFLGDFFDTFKTPDGAIIYGVTQTCVWINEKFEELGDKAVWLCGNHDCAYLASYTKDYTKTKQSPYYYCSGWSKNKAKYFNKTINPEWINSLELCVQLGKNTVASHAGFHYRMFQPYTSEINNINEYYGRWEREKHIFHHEPWHWIWDVGRCRGGMAIVGSPVWLDWNQEFVPLDNVSQVVGHTTMKELSLRVKQNGQNLKNWCIDHMQQVYGVWEDENFVVKNLKGEVLS